MKSGFRLQSPRTQNRSAICLEFLTFNTTSLTEYSADFMIPTTVPPDPLATDAGDCIKFRFQLLSFLHQKNKMTSKMNNWNGQKMGSSTLHH